MRLLRLYFPFFSLFFLIGTGIFAMQQPDIVLNPVAEHNLQKLLQGQDYTNAGQYYTAESKMENIGTGFFSLATLMGSYWVNLYNSPEPISYRKTKL